MGKYGNGVSIADVIRYEREAVEQILDENGVTDKDKKDVIDSLMEMAYHWAYTNEWARVMEQYLPADGGIGRAIKLGNEVRERMKKYGDLFADESEAE